MQGNNYIIIRKISPHNLYIFKRKIGNDEWKLVYKFSRYNENKFHLVKEDDMEYKIESSTIIVNIRKIIPLQCNNQLKEIFTVNDFIEREKSFTVLQITGDEDNLSLKQTFSRIGNVKIINLLQDKCLSVIELFLFSKFSSYKENTNRILISRPLIGHKKIMCEHKSFEITEDNIELFFETFVNNGGKPIINNINIIKKDNEYKLVKICKLNFEDIFGNETITKNKEIYVKKGITSDDIEFCYLEII